MALQLRVRVWRGVGDRVDECLQKKCKVVAEARKLQEIPKDLEPPNFPPTSPSYSSSAHIIMILIDFYIHSVSCAVSIRGIKYASLLLCFHMA